MSPLIKVWRSTRYGGGRSRATYMCRPNVGDGACWSLSAPAIDHAVSQLFLDGIQPSDIELSLAGLREAEQQADDVDRQWKLRLERVRYDAQLAERRYTAIDPDHRVVARTLEREWNDKLVEVERVEREYQEVRRRANIDLSEDDRARMLSLAKDLPAVWRAKTTTNAERKNLLRLVVREVTVSPIDVPGRMPRVQVLWPTGAVSDVTVPRTDKYTAQATSAQARSLIRDRYLTQRKDDREIATQLNRRGLCTGQDRAWDLGAVRRVRCAEGIFRPSPKARRPPDQRRDGLHSVHALAARAGVKPSAIRYWARTGALERQWRTEAQVLVARTGSSSMRKRSIGYGTWPSSTRNDGCPPARITDLQAADGRKIRSNDESRTSHLAERIRRVPGRRGKGGTKSPSTCPPAAYSDAIGIEGGTL